MDEFVVNAVSAYVAVAFICTVMCAIFMSEGSVDDNPLIYVFWPIVALNALALHLVRKWKS